MITVTNAQNRQQAEIFPEKIFGLSYSESLKATILISIGGAQFPVLESKEAILELINNQSQEKVCHNNKKETN